MSTSRSVAAAQRRRAGPPESQQVRGPNTSINSSQVFSGQQQLRPGTTGRIAGQQAALQQQQFQQQQQQSNLKQDNSQQGSKMTLPQAITLITLRLGRLETQVSQLDTNNSLVNENGEVVDSQLIDSILERLDFLEQEKQNNVNTNNHDIKQQLEVLKSTINTVRNSCAVNSREINTFKNELDILKTDLSNTKFIVEELQASSNFSENVDNEEVNNDILLDNSTLVPNVTETEEQNLELIQELELELESTLDKVNEHLDESLIKNQEIETDFNFEKDTESSSNTNDNISLKEIIQQELKQSGISIVSNTQPQISNKKSAKSQRSAK
jgi:hypothetical protein